MIRLPVIHNETSHATAIVVVGRELVLEPARVWNDRWHVRQDRRLVLASADDYDAFILNNRIVTDGVNEWTRLSYFLRDRNLFVPGDSGVLADAERAGHWGRITVPLEPWRGQLSDSGLAKTLARGVQQMEAA